MMSERQRSGAVGLKIFECEEYEELEVPRPAIRVRIIDPITNEILDLVASVDTGFAGYMLVPSELYDKVSSLELPASEFNTYVTVSGPVRMKGCKVYFEICGLRFPGILETPLLGYSSILIGRRILNKVRIALLGPERKLCFLKLDSSLLKKLLEQD
mgnify:CR=1 FL=1